ncbi:MAG: ABC transporter substrate-binding protein [Candidatus Bathyarchaeia archaeon]
MENKDAHLYTAGWSLGIEPDSIVLWRGDAGIGPEYSYYWHPGRCYNTPYANDPEFNYASLRVETANSEAEAVQYMEICNRRAAEAALNGPMFVYSSQMAAARKYVGGTPEEADYVGNWWNGTVMVTGYGLDSYFGFLNMHPMGYERPEYGTIRYAFKTTDIRSFNTIYAEWVWDNNVLDLVYDGMVASNPYNLNERLPWMCSNYTVGTYVHPTYGTCTKVTFTLRPDMTWTDGTPISLKDVYFTLVELPKILRIRGFPNPWWYSSVRYILSFTQLDPYSFEVLINVKSIWAFGLTGAGVRIMPEHIWRPICESGDPTAIAPDPNMISSGPWRFREYVASGYVDLVANKPGRTVRTSHTGSTDITSPYGYYRYYPLQCPDVTVDGLYIHKFDSGVRTLGVSVFNELYYDNIVMDMNVEMTWANGTVATLADLTDITVAPRDDYTWTSTFLWPYGKHVLKVTITTKTPTWAANTKVTEETFWVTIKEDIGGASFLGSVAPDLKVDGKDIAVASKAFGTRPGDARWSSVAEVTGDYKIDGKDLAKIGKMFGWRP